MFRLVGTTSYSLAAGQTVPITICFNPTATGDFTMELTFSNTSVTPNQQVTLTLLGTCTEKAKQFSVFGCAPVSSGGGYLSDFLVMMGGLMVLFAGIYHVKKRRVDAK